MVLDDATLPNDVEELKRELLRKTAQVEALKAEVLRLRRWRFGRSSEGIDGARAPELPLAGGAVTSSPVEDPANTLPKIPKLVSVEPSRESRVTRRAPRALPPELPRVVEVHAPSSCTCPDCGGVLRKLGEDVSEQLDYVPGYFRVIRHVRPKLSCRACARIVQESAPSRPIERGLPTAYQHAF